MRILRLALSLLLVLTAFSAYAQVVKERSSGLGRLRRAGEAAAEKANKSSWPLVNDQDDGTQVHITFDFQNTDIIFMSYPPPSREAMLGECKRIAHELGYDRADYLVYPAKTYFPLDIEINKYLPSGKVHAFTYDLDKLGKLLAESKVFPKPIMIHIEGDEADEVVLTNSTNQSSTLGDSTILELKDIAPGAKLTFKASVDWTSYVGAALLVGILGFGLYTLVMIPWRFRPKPIVAAPELDPEAIQRQYDTNRWKSRLIAFAPLLILLFAFGGRNFLTKATRILPEPDFLPDARSIFGGTMLFFVVLVGGSWGLRKLWQLRQRLRGEAPPEEDPAEKALRMERLGSMRYMWILMLPVPVMMSVLFIPGVATLDQNIRRLIIFCPVFICIPIFAVMAMRASRSAKTVLKPGDHWYDITQEIARRADMTVRNVVIVKGESVNAFANLVGTVGITSSLLEKLDEPEIRGIIAHEIGHLKARHVVTVFGISLAVTTAWILFQIYFLQDRVSREVGAILNSPLIGFYLFPIVLSLILGGRRRRNETEADRFAVEMTGDPETYIGALVKVHTLNASPARLDKIDEKLSSHPSLDNRIKAIRAVT